mgnify:CR=1 FL=1
MSDEAAKIQSRLIRDLEPVVAVELERHLSVQKNWYPHEYVPWSEGRDYAGPLNGDAWEAKDSRLTPVAQDSLVLNLLTEDNLPSYHTEIALSMGRDGAWGNWIERWTAEEARHAIVIRDYLMATRGVDPYELGAPQKIYWLRDWLTGPEREESGPVMIEKALCRMYKLKPPTE